MSKLVSWLGPLRPFTKVDNNYCNYYKALLISLGSRIKALQPNIWNMTLVTLET